MCKLAPTHVHTHMPLGFTPPLRSPFLPVCTPARFLIQKKRCLCPGLHLPRAVPAAVAPGCYKNWMFPSSWCRNHVFAQTPSSAPQHPHLCLFFGSSPCSCVIPAPHHSHRCLWNVDRSPDAARAGPNWAGKTLLEETVLPSWDRRDAGCEGGPEPSPVTPTHTASQIKGETQQRLHTANRA